MDAKPTSRRDLRRRIDQFVAHPGCDANVCSVVLDVPMRKVAERELPSGHPSLHERQSPFAIARGVTFERSLYDHPERILEPLVKAGALPAAHGGVLDLRLRAHGGPLADLDASAVAFTSFLRGLAKVGRDVDVTELTALVVAPTMKLPGAPLMKEGAFSADLVIVRLEPAARRGARFTLSVGEVKVYPDRGGHTDRAQLAGARAQAGMYVHAMRRVVASLGLADAIGVDDRGFLVLAHPSSNRPSVRWPEDLRWQARRAESWWTRLSSVAAEVLDDAAREGDPMEAVLAAETAYEQGCASFCARAPSCRKRAQSAGDPAVLGDEVARLVGPVTLIRAEALLRGRAKPATPAEEDLVRRVAAVDRAKEAVG